mmetsp:Transcript_1389/g.3033  ORF Transcript_1389/g.3033 Transcript_1389/m.3033 type:complete len:236 (+) Transcript_1389:1399-2106(+)
MFFIFQKHSFDAQKQTFDVTFVPIIVLVLHTSIELSELVTFERLLHQEHETLTIENTPFIAKTWPHDVVVPYLTRDKNRRDEADILEPHSEFSKSHASVTDIRNFSCFPSVEINAQNFTILTSNFLREEIVLLSYCSVQDLVIEIIDFRLQIFQVLVFREFSRDFLKGTSFNFFRTHTGGFDLGVALVCSLRKLVEEDSNDNVEKHKGDYQVEADEEDSNPSVLTSQSEQTPCNV